MAKPHGRTLSDFRIPSAATPNQLKPGEEELLKKCRIGEFAELGNLRPKQATGNNTVRASFVRFLALGGDDSAPVHEQGVQLYGAWVEGELNLEGAHVLSNLFLSHCRFDAELWLRGAHIHGSLFLPGSLVPSLSADQMVCEGDVFLNDKFVATDKVRLLGAQIGGDLDCGNAFLHGRQSDAFSADRATVNGNVVLNKAFSAKGRVSLWGTQINGDLLCSGARLDGMGGTSLSANGVHVNGDVYMQKHEETDEKEKTRYFTAIGEVSLLDARIGGILQCSGARLDGKGGDALSADRATIKGDVFLDAGFAARGQVRLPGAQIGGDLACRDAKFDCAKVESEGGNALAADRANITGNVFLDDGSSVRGGVNLSSAQIGINFDCLNATLDGNGGNALFADRMTVAGAFRIFDMKSPVNNVSLSHARVGALIDDEQSWGKGLVLDGFVYGSIADGSRTNAQARLKWLDLQSKAHRGISLTEKKEKKKTEWQDEKGIIDFRPQPWRQLQKVLREMGHMEDAREVAIALDRRRYDTDLIGQPPAGLWRVAVRPYRTLVRVLHWFYGELIGYGYRPLQTVGWMFLVWIICAGIYWYAALEGVFAPTSPTVFQNHAYAACMPEKNKSKNPYSRPVDMPPEPPQPDGNWYTCRDLADEYTTFSPLAYSLSVILPVVDLQQEKDWAPMVETPRTVWYEELLAFDKGRIIRLLVWFEILFGWLSSLLLVTTLSGLAKLRDDN